MIQSNVGIVQADLEHILKHTTHLWKQLYGAHVFITGGTGFIGKWLLESLFFANERLELDIKVLILTRNIADFVEKAPHLALNKAVKFHEGDIRNFEFPLGDFTHVIHGAADTSPDQNCLEAYDVIVNGMRRVLDFCRERQVEQLLSLSSGAVYGMQSPDLMHVSEQCISAPEVSVPRTAYGQAKRISEWLSAVYEAQYQVKSKIARCFALAGTYLPLNAHYALGNFILDAVRNKKIQIKGDGRPIRSYLYAADMTIWLWTIFINGQSNTAYNLGSEEAISLKDLAWKIAKLAGSEQGVEILSEINYEKKAECYVPSTQLARESLGLQTWTSLDEALLRMISWVKATQL